MITVAVSMAWAVTTIPAATILLAASLVVGAALIVDMRRVGAFTPLLPLSLAVLSSLTIPALQGYFDGSRDFGISAEANISAAAVFGVFTIIATLTYVLAGGGSPTQTGRGQREVLSPFRAKACFMLSLVVGSFGLHKLFDAAGGAGQYISGLSNRRVALEGMGPMLATLLVPAAVSLVLLAAHWTHQRDTKGGGGRSLPLAVFVLSAIFLLATGNRMNLVVYVAAIAFIRHRYWTAARAHQIIVGLFVVVFIGLGLPSLLRGAAELSERSFEPVSLREQYAEFGPVNTFGQAPALALAIQHDVPRANGLTYAAAATMFIPRSVAPWKYPDAGQYVTERTLSRYWLQSGTGFQIGAAGEAWINFGWLGVTTVAMLSGLLMRQLARLSSADSPGMLLAFAVALPRVALYFRGGFATVTTYLALELLIIFATLLFVVSRSSTGRAPLARAGSPALAPKP